MTEQEAISYLERFESWNEDDEWLRPDVMKALVAFCTKSLEEIRQYREIGSVGKCREAMKKDRWISVEERLPEEKINPVSQDYYEYQVTAMFEGLLDVRSYKFGNGHWWNGPGIVDQYVIAWKENPEPYRAERGDEE